MNENYIMVHGRKIELSQETVDNIKDGLKIKEADLTIPKEFDIKGNGTTTPEECLKGLKRQERILKDDIEKINIKMNELLNIYIGHEQLLDMDFTEENKYVIKRLIKTIIKGNSDILVIAENRLCTVKKDIKYVQNAIDHYDIINICFV